MKALQPVITPPTASPASLDRTPSPAVGAHANNYPLTETVSRTITGPFPGAAPSNSQPQLNQQWQAQPQYQQWQPQDQQWQQQPPQGQQWQSRPQYYQQWQSVPYQAPSATYNPPSALVPFHFSPAAPAPAPAPPATSPTTIPGFFAPTAAQSQPHMAVFGAAFVADNAEEIFYIREKPVAPQPGDGIIKQPAPGQLQFQDAFKVDVTGHGVTAQRTLKDLPSKEVISCQRRRKSAMSATVMICSGSVADSKNMVASVRKSGDSKAIIELEKRGQTMYVAEGDLLKRSYTVSRNGTQVAQVMYDENARAAVTSKHSYAVQVAPGTDCVLMITAAMAIEDIYHA